MQLTPLYRSDFAQVSTTNKHCMVVVPSCTLDQRGKTKDKVVVGAQNGTVICVGRKVNETDILFKTPPGSAITSVTLGGSAGSLANKVFVSSETNVKGLNRKGKQFFSFDTNMAEPVRRMFISGVDLFLTGRKSFNHYHDCADANYYLSPDEILDVVSLVGGAWSDRPTCSVLACADATIRVLEQSKVAYEHPMNDVPQVLHLFLEDGGHSKQKILYGTKGGSLGLIELGNKHVHLIWEVPTTTGAGVTSITCYPFFESEKNKKNIILGKEDGVIEVYDVETDDSISLRASHNCDETVTAVACGRVCSETADEIIVCTYTGWVFSLGTVALSSKFNNSQATGVNVKVEQLRAEIEELEQKVNEERSKYNELAAKEDGTDSAYVPRFQVHDQFVYNPQLGVYSLVIELVFAIDFIVVQSFPEIELIEVEKNSSVVSMLKRSEHNPWPLLASYRCQANTNRLELRVKVNEGVFGRLNVYICPTTTPRVSQLKQYDIRPLSAHVRSHAFDVSRPMNTLTITGSFSAAEAHNWLYLLLPDIPLKCPSSETITSCFSNVSSGGTQLQIVYTRNSATFRSDSMSTIAIIRERISDETIKKQMKVHVQCDLNEESVEFCLRLLHPKMTYLLGLHTRRMLAEALKELQVNCDDLSFLSDENRRLLDDHDVIYEESLKFPMEESHLPHIYEALLVDRGRLNGRNIRHRVEALHELITQNYTLDSVISFFKSNY